MTYRPRATPLHAAGAVAALSWCAALGIAALLASAAAPLLAVAVTVLAAGGLAGVGGALRRALAPALVLGLSVTVINALVSEQGSTVLWNFGSLPLVGFRYVTAQGVGAGALLGLRAVTLVVVGVLISACVDPDGLLAVARRISFRSALTATVATRLVPVLARDARRLADAQRTRSIHPPGRMALLNASTHGMLDRALDIAATLEVRGFGLPSARRALPRARNRHDVGFGCAALASLVLAGASSGITWWLGIALPAVALVPFLDRRGIG